MCVIVCAAKNLIQEQSLCTLFISVSVSVSVRSLVSCPSIHAAYTPCVCLFLVLWITTRSCWLLPTFERAFLCCYALTSLPPLFHSHSLRLCPQRRLCLCLFLIWLARPLATAAVKLCIKETKSPNLVAIATKLYEKGWKMLSFSLPVIFVAGSLSFSYCLHLCKLMLVCDFLCYIYIRFSTLKVPNGNQKLSGTKIWKPTQRIA